MKWKCPVCGKVYENFGIKDFYSCPKTTLFGSFIRIEKRNKTVQKINRLVNRPVCSTECKETNEKKYFVEEYKGNKIYCVNGKYMHYLECEYWYDNIEGVKNRIDNPKFIPVTHTIVEGLCRIMNGVD